MATKPIAIGMNAALLRLDGIWTHKPNGRDALCRTTQYAGRVLLLVGRNILT